MEYRRARATTCEDAPVAEDALEEGADASMSITASFTSKTMTEGFLSPPRVRV